MASLGLLYIDGVSAVSGRYTIKNSDTYTVTSTGITFTGTFMEGSSPQTWTYSGTGTFAGFAITSGATTPHTNLEIGDSGTFNDGTWWGSGGVELYTVEATASNDPYLTTGFDLTSIADAIRTKTWGTSDLTFPSQYISSISNLPTGSIQSSRSVIYNSPGSAMILPSSGYVGFESASIEFAPNVWDGQYTWTPPPEPTLEGTTWLFNDPYGSGAFVCYDTSPAPSVIGIKCDYQINFTSNGNNYTHFWTANEPAPGNYVYNDYMSPKWTNQAYRTITITGGDDVNNSDLKDLLEGHAIQIS